MDLKQNKFSCYKDYKSAYYPNQISDNENIIDSGERTEEIGLDLKSSSNKRRNIREFILHSMKD